MSEISNLHNNKSEGIGVIEGKALSKATYDTLVSLSTDIKVDQLPTPKFIKPIPESIKPVSCGSDKDCKGDRICEDGKCVNPSPQKNIKGAGPAKIDPALNIAAK